MEYSAGMVSQVFAFLESKKLAELLNQGMSKEEAWKEVEENNLFQLRNATRLTRFMMKQLHISQIKESNWIWIIA